MTYDDFPPGTEEMWDMTAKALLLREGGVVKISKAELDEAAATQCQIELMDDGSIVFRLEDMPVAN